MECKIDFYFQDNNCTSLAELSMCTAGPPSFNKNFQSFIEVLLHTFPVQCDNLCKNGFTNNLQSNFPFMFYE